MTTLIRNTRGSTVATISDLMADTTTPLTLVGDNFADYGATVQESIYHTMENFASDTPPADPVVGMTWFAVTAKVLSVWDGSSWVALGTASNIFGALLSRMAGADAVDFSTTGSVNVHTGAAGKKTYITDVLMVPRTGASVTGANVPAFQLEVTAASGDVCDELPMLGMTDDTSFFAWRISGTNKIVQAADVVKINKKRAISSGTLLVDLYLFGHVR